MDSSSIILFDANMYKVEVVCFVASFKVDDGEKMRHLAISGAPQGNYRPMSYTFQALIDM